MCPSPAMFPGPNPSRHPALRDGLMGGAHEAPSHPSPAVPVPYLPNLLVSVTTCWKVGRFWNGNGAEVIPAVTVGRFWSKQDGCGFAAQAPLPPP